jgi:hypothetical protein
MNKKYFEELYNRLQYGEVLNNTERVISRSYQKMEMYEYDWLSIDSASDIDAVELVRIMKESNVKEIYIDGEWSNQFANWYTMQEAGLEMVGIRKIDNPMYIYETKKYDDSTANKTKFILVFKLKDN